MTIFKVLYNLSLSLWVGGTAIFTLMLTPIIFKSYSRDIAGQIVGTLFPSYFRWGLACGACALICRLFLKDSRLLVPIIICSMLAVTSFQAFYLEPKITLVKKQIPSFETTPKTHPLRREFARLHGISAGCNIRVIGSGIVLIVLL
jgi:hypothetical protein